MKRLVDADLPQRAARYLETFQRELDALLTNADDSATIETTWSSKRRNAKATFRDVKLTLLAMHGGDLHCCYCELSKANGIDHFRPKSMYPSQTFVWENFVYACSDCNTFRGNRFAIFDDPAAMTPIEINRDMLAANLGLRSGEEALIDPRKEDPSALLHLDLVLAPAGRTPFKYRPARGVGPRQAARADYTIATLGLNIPDLIRGRSIAFVAYRDILSQHVQDQSESASLDESALRVDAILRLPHRAVWEEMKRWHINGWLARVPALASLEASFAAAPEALAW